MLPYKASLSGDFIRRMNERSDKWASIQSIASTITVPDDMIWWYYNEYGTANLGEPGGRTYDIDPKGNGALSFPGPGGQVFAHHVNHPGIKASHMVGLVREEINAYVRQTLTERLPQDFSPDDVRGLLSNDIMPEVKQMIVKSFAQQLPGTRPDGRLKGESAADVFDQKSTIVDTST